MKSGKILERRTEELWANPKNDYTKTYDSIPIPDPKKERARLMDRAKKFSSNSAD